MCRHRHRCGHTGIQSAGVMPTEAALVCADEGSRCEPSFAACAVGTRAVYWCFRQAGARLPSQVNAAEKTLQPRRRLFHRRCRAGGRRSVPCQADREARWWGRRAAHDPRSLGEGRTADYLGAPPDQSAPVRNLRLRSAGGRGPWGPAATPAAGGRRSKKDGAHTSGVAASSTMLREHRTRAAPHFSARGGQSTRLPALRGARGQCPQIHRRTA